jgi:hypothetical protein
MAAVRTSRRIGLSASTDQLTLFSAWVTQADEA